MKMRQSILGLLAFTAIIIVAGGAYASCGISDRVTFHHTECLHGWWDNNNWPKKSTFGAQAQNDCHLWDKVVAKVDLRSCSDKTWHLTNTNARRGSEACTVNGIYCCKDLGVCRKADYVTIDGCTSQWNKSSASDYCELSGGETYTSGTTSPSPITASSANLTCSVWAKCQYITPEWTLAERQTSIKDVHWLDTDDLVNCNGTLKVDSC